MLRQIWPALRAICAHHALWPECPAASAVPCPRLPSSELAAKTLDPWLTYASLLSGLVNGLSSLSPDTSLPASLLPPTVHPPAVGPFLKKNKPSQIHLQYLPSVLGGNASITMSDRALNDLAPPCPPLPTPSSLAPSAQPHRPSCHPQHAKPLSLSQAFALAVPLLRTLRSHIFAQLPSPQPSGLSSDVTAFLVHPCRVAPSPAHSHSPRHRSFISFPFSEAILRSVGGWFACVVCGLLP